MFLTQPTSIRGANEHLVHVSLEMGVGIGNLQLVCTHSDMIYIT